MAAHKEAGISGRRRRRRGRMGRTSYWQRIIKYNCHKTLSFCLRQVVAWEDWCRQQLEGREDSYTMSIKCWRSPLLQLSQEAPCRHAQAENNKTERQEGRLIGSRRREHKLIKFNYVLRQRIYLWQDRKSLSAPKATSWSRTKAKTRLKRVYL